MHPRQASLVAQAAELSEKTAAGKKRSEGGPVIWWKYTDPEGVVFYMETKRTSVKSPISGKSFSARPERFSPAQAGKDMKEEGKKEVKKASEETGDETYARKV